MGCDIPKVIEFRSLPVGVQDNLMQGRDAPDDVATIQDFLLRAHVPLLSHDCDEETDARGGFMPQVVTSAGIENMYPSAIDKKHRDWINSLMYTPGGPPDAVHQLIFAAPEMCSQHPPSWTSMHQLDLFLFKDIGIGGILSKLISQGE